jgi:carbonic anhydrase
MMYLELLERNALWAERMRQVDPAYFEKLAARHTPSTLFIGCADARTPLNLVTDTGLGELFIHRNIANQVHPSDTSFSASLQYAVDVLCVTDVVVCGHLGCGGVRAALAPEPAPDHVEAWISPLRMLARLHDSEIGQCHHHDHKVDKLVELNVIEQVRLLARHSTVRKAWQAGRTLRLHGWVFDLPRGVLVPKIEAVAGSEVYPQENGERRAAL